MGYSEKDFQRLDEIDWKMTPTQRYRTWGEEALTDEEYYEMLQEGLL